MAVFLDLENIAIGAREAHYPTFEVQKVLERLLLKGHIVVKKAYCDFDRYKEFKRGLHEAAFELIEIPHVRQSGKNSADIRMVVDALDLCYTKNHVNAFVIVSGDSDFSPLVSKLRENAKTVIGVGVRNSTSDLFINNCDEFLYYDDLVGRARESRSRAAANHVSPAASRRRGAKSTAAEPEPTTSLVLGPTGTPVETKVPVASPAPADGAAGGGADVAKALDLVVETLEALTEERDEDEAIWGSMVKQALRRRNPGFNERAYGYRSFNDLLLEGERRGLLKLQADEKSGGYTLRTIDEG